jgi:DNA-binding NtrC family response regulator
LPILSGERRIDAVITDVRMPGSIDGVGLCRWMGEHAAGIPVLVTSGLDAQALTDLVNPAVFRIVSKPYRPSQVAAELARHLGAEPPSG